RGGGQPCPETHDALPRLVLACSEIRAFYDRIASVSWQCLFAAIHVLLCRDCDEDVDARPKAGHDGGEACAGFGPAITPLRGRAFPAAPDRIRWQGISSAPSRCLSRRRRSRPRRW